MFSVKQETLLQYSFTLPKSKYYIAIALTIPYVLVMVFKELLTIIANFENLPGLT